MKLTWLIHQLYHEPALITPEAHSSIRQLLEARLDDAIAFDPEAAKRQGEYCGKKVDLPSMEVIDGIAHIPIGGAIGAKLSGFAKAIGAVDSQDVARDVAEAEADPRVKAILFDIDSPGGMVTGTAELADLVAAAKKPTAAFTDGMMASAAYWIGSATGAVYATRSAQLGSIGVYLPVMDMKGYYEQMGVKIELIKGGKLKGIGYPGTSLSDTAREFLQNRVNQLYAEFKTHVRAMRGPGIAEETMQGQTFYGPESVSRGLADALVRSKADAVELLRP
jgi:signal peptide peptidase SppA